jgi:hypothetical protein
MNLPTVEQTNSAKQIRVWDFGNAILYDLCQKNFRHVEDDKIVAKVLFIGRIYAAAVERRRNKKEGINDDFYTDTIAPTFRNSELDDLLNELSKYKELSVDSISSVLEVHSYLTNLLKRITDLEKRSFSSKYLHFHLPDLFFIYDSRAVIALRQFTSQVPKDLQKFIDIANADTEYAKFFIKCFDMKRSIQDQYHTHITNRQLDNILIDVANKKIHQNI